ncbi:unnamed protein product [Peronospora destructor]|uniref:FYVE-type domain-containing protein n=1 Tax=Peronospora destructor TaxID=86335 RepID=A0AAV0V1N7_9STRA|nr:unnamed protein product [Peronospora destructor]
MGCPSSCNECGKKFKVFGIKKKCKYCMGIVCKACLDAHLELKHTGPRGNCRRRKSCEIFDTTGNDKQPELQFLSPAGSPDLELEYTDTEELQVVDSIEAVSDENDDDGILCDDDAEDDVDDDDELLMKRLSRHLCVEDAVQYKELCKVQGMVATWATKEKHVKQEMRREVYDYENCSMFAVSYAMMATVAVWTLFGLLLAVYLRGRSLQADYSYVL